MKKSNLILIVLLVLQILVFLSCDKKTTESDNTPHSFTKTFGGSGFDCGTSVTQTSEKGYIITGFTESFGAGNYDVWLIKTDESGNEEWNQTFGGSSKDEGWSVKQTTDGGYIIAGSTTSYGSGSSDVWLIKTDSNGNEIWNKTFGGGGSDYGYSVEQTDDGGYIITGGTRSYGPDPEAVWLIKTDVNGEIQWSRTLGDGSNCNYDGDRGRSVIQTIDSGYFIAGTNSYLLENCVCYDFLLIKTNSSGIMEWSSTFDGGEHHAQAYSCQEVMDGYVVTGYNGSGTAGDIVLIKINTNGILEWEQYYSGTTGFSVKQTDDGGYVITGNDYLRIIKTDANGNQEFNNFPCSCSWMDVGYSVSQTTDGGYIITGRISDDLWLIKTDSEGNVSE